MKSRKFLSLFKNDDMEVYEFKNTWNLFMAISCWMLGSYPIEIVPLVIFKHDAAIEICIPVIIVSIFLTIPLTFLSLGMSQYSRRGWIKIWDASPVWRGIGIAGVICLYLCCIYSTTRCTYYLYYAALTFSAKIPWLECSDQDFQVQGCFTYGEGRSYQLDCLDHFNKDHCTNISWQNSAESFVRTIHPQGKHYNWYLVPFKLVIIVMIFVCIMNSIKSFEIYAPFLIVCPTIIQAILVVKALLHPGSLKVLELLAQFKIEKILSTQLWLEIIISHLVSISYACGGLSTFAMHQNFRSPAHMEAVFLVVTSVTYSLFYTVFLYLMYGILSFELNLPVRDIFQMSYIPNYIQCPLVFSYWKMTKFWTFLFFISNFLIVFRSLVAQCEVIMNILYEAKPGLRFYTIPCTLIFSTTLFVLNILANFSFFYEFLKNVYSGMCLVIFPLIAFYISIFIAFFYGVQHFVDDMHFMLGLRPSNVWKASWYLGFLVYFMASIGGINNFPPYLKSASFFMKFFVVIATVILAALPLIYFTITILMKWKTHKPIIDVLKPLNTWGPEDEILKKSRDMFSAHDMTKEYLYRQQRLKHKPTDDLDLIGSRIHIHEEKPSLVMKNES